MRRAHVVLQQHIDASAHVHSSHTMSLRTPLALSASVTYSFTSLLDKHHEFIFYKQWRLIIKSFPNLWSSWMNHWTVNDVNGHLFTCVTHYALCFNLKSYLGFFHDLDGKTAASCVMHVSATIFAANHGYQTQQMAVERVCSVKRFTLWLLSLFIHNISLIHPSSTRSKTVHLYPICRIYCKGRLFAPPYCKKWCLQMWPDNTSFISSCLQGPLLTL